MVLMIMITSWLLLLLLLPVDVTTAKVVARFRDSAESLSLFRHLTVDPQTGRVYIGAKNFLHQLDPELRSLHRVRTGPDLDSPHCNYNGDCIWTPGTAPTARAPTDNYNQLLVVHPEHKVLIACGTLFQGICSAHRLDDVSKIVQAYDAHSTPVAANSPDASTVAFVGPGPSANEPVLYVGATFTFDSYRDRFPAVSSRSLNADRLMHLLDPGDISGQSAMIIQSDHRSDFHVHYRGGFTADGFAYWVAVQPKSVDTGAPFLTKLLRVCTNDRRFQSYAEVPLECLGPDNANYNVLQAFHVGELGNEVVAAAKTTDRHFFVGVFTKDSTPDPAPGHRSLKSAICVFPMKDIRAAFWYNIQRCNSGIGTWNLPQFGLNQRCHNVSGLAASTQAHQDQCQHIRVGGSIPATSIAAKVYDDARLTSIAVDVLDQARTVFFVGTSKGKLKKLVLESTRRAYEYDELLVSSDGGHSGLLTDMQFDTSRQHVYVLTNDEVLKVRLQSCSSYSNCSSCVASGDPYCGWCTLENKCVLKEECTFVGDKQQHGFLISAGLESDQCPRVESVEPANVSLHDTSSTVKQVHLTLNFIPPPAFGDQYQCVFLHAHVAAEFLPPNKLLCQLPKPEQRPRITINRDFVTVPLKVWSSRSQRAILQTTFTFYDCSFHKLCTACVQSRWHCDWCLEDSLCVRDSGTCSNQVRISHNDQLWLVPKQLHDNNDDTAENTALLSNTCPHVNVETPFEVLLPENYPTAVSVPVVNVDKLSLGNDDMVVCVTEVEGRAVRVRGSLSENGKTLLCEEYAYSYDARLPSVAAELHLQTGKGTKIDKLKAVLYKCELMASDCSRCLDLDRRYECAWCDGGCRLRKSCSDQTAIPYPQSLAVCPAPVIEDIFPTVGPIEGGTHVEIIGHDLGLRQSDVDQRVSVAGVPCRVTEYHTSEKIVCVTDASPRDSLSGPVVVDMEMGRRGRSQLHFTFTDPKVTGYHPTTGPQSGGTEFVITGEHLLEASVVDVHIGAMPCHVRRDKSTSRNLVCITSAAPAPNITAERILVQLDRASRTLAGPFFYAADPVIFSISPKDGFRSGGRRLLIHGQQLNSVQKPLMYLINRNGLIQSEASICQVLNSTTMLCPSPALIPGSDRLKRASDEWKTSTIGSISNSRRYDVGFLMDNVETVRHLGSEFGFTIFSDPIYYAFPGGVKVHRGSGPLVIEGSNLNSASSIYDVTVLVGDHRCNVTLLASTQLICLLSSSESGPVSIRVGNLQFELGKLILEDDQPLAAAGQTNMALLGGLVGGCCSLAFLVIVGAAIWWRNKSTLAEKEYRRIQLQMDNLESNVRQECKEAFAELQTDMSDLTSDLVALGIPYRSRIDFINRVLFKEEHRSVLQMSTVKRFSKIENSATVQNALIHFEQLLMNRQFVVSWVRTLEGQSSFAAPDKVYVGSLLTAALMNNMQYLTEVVIALLRQLIARAGLEKHPQVMLRRTESVVEKMLANWIALCLYEYLQGPSGSSLFLLFKALKHQTEKGPVDAVTFDARYSLSEDRLLKEQIDYETLYFKIIPPKLGDNATPTETVICRVLSCDSIRQLKSKILDCLYKNTAFSSRPTVHDIDLEWHGHIGVVLLREHPHLQTRRSDGWIRLNTVRDYRLPNQAVIVVVLRSSSYSGYTDFSTHTYASIDSSACLISSSSNCTSKHQQQNNKQEQQQQQQQVMMMENRENVDLRCWHLIRPDGTSNRRNGGTPSRITEIYLTRLLSTKGTVQQFVDDFITSTLAVEQSTFPAPIKYLFDLLEEEAARLPVADPGSVAQAWKNNSLPLRFWVNIIKNPDFIFDVEKTITVDSCLSVIAQMFMDACSSSEPQLGKDSPSNKLLFARDLPRYRAAFGRFYNDIRHLPTVTDQELNSLMAPLSSLYSQQWNTNGALRELFLYSLRYQDQILNDLRLNPVAQRQHLADRFEEVVSFSK
ncbi:Plexin-B [Trichinella spiralis]|uniref:Plexin-B n=1 Tax=Trichinella spiralis TaxID=6334 RepID=A0ABR3KPK7_TRISP